MILSNKIFLLTSTTNESFTHLRGRGVFLSLTKKQELVLWDCETKLAILRTSPVVSRAEDNSLFVTRNSSYLFKRADLEPKIALMTETSKPSADISDVTVTNRDSYGDWHWKNHRGGTYTTVYTFSRPLNKEEFIAFLATEGKEIIAPQAWCDYSEITQRGDKWEYRFHRAYFD